MPKSGQIMGKNEFIFAYMTILQYYTIVGLVVVNRFTFNPLLVLILNKSTAYKIQKNNLR